MISNPLPIPLRPVSLGALLEAADASGLPDEVVARLVDRWFPDAWIPSWETGTYMRPNADAHGVLHNTGLELVGGYQDSLPDMPTNDQIDASNAAAVIRRNVLDEERGGGM